MLYKVNRLYLFTGNCVQWMQLLLALRPSSVPFSEIYAASLVRFNIYRPSPCI